MKNILFVLALTLILTGCKEKIKESTHMDHGIESNEPTNKKTLSPHTSAMAVIGDAHIHIDYSSPGVRGRIIFGGLLPLNEVWQSGAHMATWIETNKDLIINDQLLKSGKYGFFTIPSEDKWTIIFNNNWNQHGKDDYNEKDDVLRFEVKPVTLDETIEHLEYKVKAVSQDKGLISLAWDKTLININFKLKD